MVRVRTDERGFTLPELLVAMVLTLIVTGGALTALQDANRAAEIGAVMTDVNQNLRVAMNMVIKDLLQAGTGVPSGGASLPTGDGSEQITRPGPPGATWTFDENWTTLPAVSPGPAMVNIDQGAEAPDINTDVVTLLYEDRTINLSPAETDPPTPTFTSIATDGSSFTFHSSINMDDDSNGLKVGDILMISNPMGNTLMEITGVSGQTVSFSSTAPSKLNQRDAPQGSISQIRYTEPDDAGSWWPTLTAARRMNMVSYYLYVPTTGPITSPHMIRRIGLGNERVVAIGVENIQLTWDLMHDQEIYTNYEEPSEVVVEGEPLTPHHIRKANLYMSARSLALFSRTGQYQRASLNTQVSLRSLALVSRYDLQ